MLTRRLAYCGLALLCAASRIKQLVSISQQSDQRRRSDRRCRATLGNDKAPRRCPNGQAQPWTALPRCVFQSCKATHLDRCYAIASPDPNPKACPSFRPLTLTPSQSNCRARRRCCGGRAFSSRSRSWPTARTRSSRGEARTRGRRRTAGGGTTALRPTGLVVDSPPPYRLVPALTCAQTRPNVHGGRTSMTVGQTNRCLRQEERDMVPIHPCCLGSTLPALTPNPDPNCSPFPYT